MKRKKVLLIGDSIRMGYDKYVKNYLADSCDVYSPEDNCRFAQYILRHLCDWKNGFNPDDLDLIHWNVGLWVKNCPVSTAAPVAVRPADALPKTLSADT